MLVKICKIKIYCNKNTKDTDTLVTMKVDVNFNGRFPYLPYQYGDFINITIQ